MAIKKKSKDSSLKDRMKKSYESKDKGGGNRPQAFDWKKVKNIKFFNPIEEKKSLINLVPYKMGKDDPLVVSGDFKVGNLSYMLDVFIHSYVGPTQAEVICPKYTFNKACPICEQAKKYWDDGKKQEAKALRAKRWCLYNVQDLKNDPNDIQLWLVKHFLFEKEMVDEARNSSDDDGMIDYSDPDDGKSILFRWGKEDTVIDGKPTKYFKAKSISFPDREEDIDPDLIEKAIPLDSLLKIQSYKEIEKLLVLEDKDESDDDDDEEDEKPKKSSKKKDDDDDDEEEEEEDEDDDEVEDEKPKKSSKKKDDDDDDEEEEEEDEDDDEGEEEEIEDPVEDDDEEDEKPKKSSKKKDDDDDDEEEEEEDEDDDEGEEEEIEDPVEDDDEEDEKPKKSSKKKEAKKSSKPKTVPGKCPYDQVFGKDCDKFQECEDCDNWDSCLKKQNELKKKKK